MLLMSIGTGTFPLRRSTANVVEAQYPNVLRSDNEFAGALLASLNHFLVTCCILVVMAPGS